MKKLTSPIFALTLVALLSACKSTDTANTTVIFAMTIKIDASSPNLRELPALMKQARDAPDLERLLNEEINIIDLDLDGDGYVDYVRVEEFKSDDTRGFKILDGEQEVAWIEVKRSPGDVADIFFMGSPAVYGYDYYRGWLAPWGEYPLFSWLWIPRSALYISPWGYGRYPGWYQRRSSMHREMSDRLQEHNRRQPNMNRQGKRASPDQNKWRRNFSSTPKPSPMPKRHANHGQASSRNSSIWQSPPKNTPPKISPPNQPIVSSEKIPDILLTIARCESGNRQFNPDGSVLRGKLNSHDIGRFQINEKLWAVKTRELGFNIYTEAGNTSFALWLHHKFGTTPWSWSSKCWSRSDRPNQPNSNDDPGYRALLRKLCAELTELVERQSLSGSKK